MGLTRRWHTLSLLVLVAILALSLLPAPAYLRGHGWSGTVPTYAQVRVRGVYHGIDLLYHGREGTLEYDWLLRPHAAARAIRLACVGYLGHPVPIRQPPGHDDKRDASRRGWARRGSVPRLATVAAWS